MTDEASYTLAMKKPRTLLPGLVYASRKANALRAWPKPESWALLSTVVTALPLYRFDLGLVDVDFDLAS